MIERVTITDVRRAGYCVRGVRRWCEVKGIDFRKFLAEGMPVEEFKSLGDDVYITDVLAVRERFRNGQK